MQLTLGLINFEIKVYLSNSDSQSTFLLLKNSDDVEVQKIKSTFD